MAETLGADLKTMANWETGRTEPALVFLPAIMAFLGFDPRPVPDSFCGRLKRARTALGWSHRELARRLGVDEGTVWKWELGIHEPTSRHRKRIGEVLGCVQ